jgi:hypothetical protein
MYFKLINTCKPVKRYNVIVRKQEDVVSEQNKLMSVDQIITPILASFDM